MTFSHIIYVFFLIKFFLSLPITPSCNLPNCHSCYFFYQSKICKECNDGYYLNLRSECIECDFHCLSCTMLKCLKCETGYTLFNDECVDSAQEKEFTPLKGCLAYNKKTYECIECEDTYQLNDGICENSWLKKAMVVYFIIASIIAIIGIVSVVIKNQKKKKLRQMSNNNNVVHQNNVAVIPNNNNQNMNLNNNQYMNVNSNNNLVNNNVQIKKVAKELNDSLTSTQSRGLNCFKCDSEQAEYKLSCGCCFCKNDIGIFEGFNDKETFEKFYGKEQKCVLCKKIVTKVDLLKYECGICLELKHHTCRLNCGCNFELCASCCNKMSKTKICPGCRKPFDSYITIIRIGK